MTSDKGSASASEQPSQSTTRALQATYEELARETNISATTLERETRIEEWRDEIDLTDPTKEQLSSYAGCALVDLRTNSQEGADFAQSFNEDFGEWTLDHFYTISRAFRRELFAALSRKGIQSQLKVTESQSRKLYEIAQGRFLLTSENPIPLRLKPSIQDEDTEGSIHKVSYENLKPSQPQTAVLDIPYPSLRTTETVKHYLPEPTPKPRSPIPQSPNRANNPTIPQAQVPSYYWQEREPELQAYERYQPPPEIQNPYDTVRENDKLPPEKIV